MPVDLYCAHFSAGCVAGDEETYDTFAALLDPIIDKRHNGYPKNAIHRTDLDSSKIVGGDNLDPKYVLSCRVRTGRSIRGYSLPPHSTRAERRGVEQILTGALDKLSGDLKGIYFLGNAEHLNFVSFVLNESNGRNSYSPQIRHVRIFRYWY